MSTYFLLAFIALDKYPDAFILIASPVSVVTLVVLVLSHTWPTNACKLPPFATKRFSHLSPKSLLKTGFLGNFPSCGSGHMYDAKSKGLAIFYVPGVQTCAFSTQLALIVCPVALLKI